MRNLSSLYILSLVCLAACSPGHFIGKSVDKELLQQPGIQPGQVGICLYDPASAQYIYNYQGDKYFMPASNTKLFSLFAGLKYLGDSLPGILYRETDTALFLVAAGDPTLLHPDYSRQPLIDLLKNQGKKIYLLEGNWQENPLGRGWAWDDYNDDYMPERSSLPVYGNVIRWVEEGIKQGAGERAASAPDNSFEQSPSFYSIPEMDWEVHFTGDTGTKSFYVQRDLNRNAFTITSGKEKHKEQDVPFITNGATSALAFLKDSIGKAIGVRSSSGLFRRGDLRQFHVLHSQPVDSLFRPMMHRSDNFFAEQTLLMVSNQVLGIMNDSRIIDTLLKTDLHELPRRPVWVDGSGLSRNNLFTPMDFIWLLNKMKSDFGLDRMKSILPTGGRGTLSNYYKQDSGYIFAKTGSLSGVVALSGYLLTKKDHLLIFSVLVNNHSDPAVRRKIERVIHMVREKY